MAERVVEKWECTDCGEQFWTEGAVVCCPYCGTNTWGVTQGAEYVGEKKTEVVDGNKDS